MRPRARLVRDGREIARRSWKWRVYILLGPRYMDSDHLARPHRRRGAPPTGERLTRDAVVAHATQLIAGQGLAAFSLRGLASSLGVAPNALYNHFHNRDDLLDAVTERFVAGIQLPGGEQPWPDWACSVATALHSQLLRHPGLTELMLARGGATAAGPRVLTEFLARLESDGVHRATAHVAWHALLTVVVGSVVQAHAGESDSRATFDAVLEITIGGLLAAAGRAPAPQAVALLHAHALTHD